MKIDCATQNFVVYSSDRSLPVDYLSTINELKKEAKEKNLESGAKASVVFSVPWYAESRNKIKLVPELTSSVLLSYPVEKPADLPTIYRDFQDVGICPRTTEKYGTKDANSLLLTGEATLDPLSTAWCFPLRMNFSQNYDGISLPKNTLDFTVMAEPDMAATEHAKELLKDEDVQINLPTKNSENVWWVKENTGSYHGPTPRTIVYVNWTGDDFTGKAMDVFGKLRTAFMEPHRRAAEKYVGVLFSMENGPGSPDNFVMNQESEPIMVSEMFCGVSHVTPFEHEEQTLVGKLYYNRFFGRR